MCMIITNLSRAKRTRAIWRRKTNQASLLSFSCNTFITIGLQTNPPYSLFFIIDVLLHIFMAKSAYSVIYLSLKYAYLQDKNSQKSTEQKTILFSSYTPLTFSPTNYCTNHQQKRIREFVLDFTLLSILSNYWYIIQQIWQIRFRMTLLLCELHSFFKLSHIMFSCKFSCHTHWKHITKICSRHIHLIFYTIINFIVIIYGI